MSKHNLSEKREETEDEKVFESVKKRLKEALDKEINPARILGFKKGGDI